MAHRLRRWSHINPAWIQRLFTVFEMVPVSDIYDEGCHQESGMVFSQPLSPLTPHTCREHCGYTYRYVGLVHGYRCACLQDLNNYVISGGSCDLDCAGSHHKCGAASSAAYANIYRTTAHLPFPDIEPICNCSVIIYSHYEEFDLPVILVNVNQTVQLDFVCLEGNLLMYNVTMGDQTPSYFTENSSVWHKYDTTGLINGNVWIKNENTTIIIDFSLVVTTPIFPVEGLSLEFPNVVATTDITYGEIRMTNGNNVECHLDLGNTTVFHSLNEDFTPSLNFTLTLDDVTTSTLNLSCQNYLSSEYVDLLIVSQEKITNFAIEVLWIFNSTDNKSISWILEFGKPLVYNLTISGNHVPVPLGSSSLDLSNLFESLGSYLATMEIQNLVSTTGVHVFQIEVQRRLSGVNMSIDNLIHQTDKDVNIYLNIKDGSHVNVSLFVNEVLLFEKFYEDVTNWSYNYTLYLAKSGTYNFTFITYNLLSREMSEFGIIVETPLFMPTIEVDDSMFCPMTAPVTLFNGGLSISASNVHVELTAYKISDNTVRISCGNTTITQFNVSVLSCHVTVEGLYNFTAFLENRVSSALIWTVARFGLGIQNLTIYINETVLTEGDSAEITIWLDYGSNAELNITFGDGTSQYIYPFAAKQLTQLTHMYSEYGIYQVRTTAENEINSITEIYSGSIYVQQPLGAISLIGPFAFGLNDDVVVNFTVAQGWPVYFSHSFEGFTSGYMLENPPVYTYVFNETTTIGDWDLQILSYNDISGPVSSNATIYIGEELNYFNMSSNPMIAKVDESIQLEYYIDSGSDVTLSIFHMVGTVTHTLIAEHFNDVTDLAMLSNVSFTEPGYYHVWGRASNDIGSLTETVFIIVQVPVTTIDVNIFQIATYKFPVQFLVNLNSGLNMPTNVTLSMETENLLTFDEDFRPLGQNTWNLTHSYTMDGVYNVTISAANLVSYIEHATTIVVGDALENCSFATSGLTFRTHDIATYTALCSKGSNIYATFVFTANLNVTLAIIAEEPTMESVTFDNPGVYFPYIIFANAFNSVTIGLSYPTVVQDILTSLTLSSDMTLYENTAFMNFTYFIGSGTNVSYELYFENTLLSFGEIEPNKIEHVTYSARTVQRFGWHKAEIIAWNDVSGNSTSNISVRVEQRIDAISLVPLFQVVELGYFSNLSVLAINGSDLEIVMEFGDDTNETHTRHLAGDPLNLSHIYTYAGKYEVMAHFVNVFGDVNITGMVWVLGGTKTLHVETTNTSDYIFPIYLYMTQSSEQDVSSNLTITIDWGDGTYDIVTGYTITYNTAMNASHVYPIDGYYVVNVTAENLVAKKEFSENIVVGLPINNCSYTLEDFAFDGHSINLITNQTMTSVILCETGSTLEIEITYSYQSVSLLQNQASGTHIRDYYSFNSPGIYFPVVTVQNVFGNLSITADIRVSVFDEVVFNAFYFNKSLHNFTENMYVSWYIEKGTNVSCAVSCSGEIIRSWKGECPHSYTLDVPRHIINQTGMYTAIIDVWNTVSNTITKETVTQVEMEIVHFDLKPLFIIISKTENVVFNITLTQGSNFTITFNPGESPTSSDSYSRQYNNFLTQISHQYNESGWYVANASISNIFDNDLKIASIWVQGPVSVLEMTVTNVSSNATPITIEFRPIDANAATDAQLIIDWGDGLSTSLYNVNVELLSPLNASHLYQSDGYYTLSVYASNNVSSKSFLTFIQVGTIIDDCHVWVDGANYMSEIILKTKEEFTVNMKCQEGSNINATVDYGDSTLENTALTSGITSEITTTYTQPALRYITVTFSNNFGEVTGHANATIVVQEPISNVNLNSDKDVVCTGCTFTIQWAFTSGTNVSCLVTFRNQSVYSDETCPYKGIIEVAASLTTDIGEYMPQFYAWNRVEPYIEKELYIIIERPIEGLYIISENIWVMNRNWSAEIGFAKGSNVNITATYNDGNYNYNRIYPGDLNTTTMQLNRYFTNSGLFDINVYASNNLETQFLTQTIIIEGAIEGLVVEIANVSHPQKKALLTITQEAGYRVAYCTVDIDWGDRENASVQGVLISQDHDFQHQHLYTREGIYNVSAICYNDVSEMIFSEQVVVGTRLDGFSSSISSPSVVVSKIVEVCGIVEKGSNITATINFKDGYTVEDPMLENFEWCVEHKYYDEGWYNISITVQNTYGSLTLHHRVKVYYGFDSVRVSVDNPVPVQEITEIGVIFRYLPENYCMLLNLGDGSNTYVYGTVECKAMYNGSIYSQPLPHSIQITVEHTYDAEGVYNVSLYASSTMTERLIQTRAVVVYCHPPVVKVEGTGSSEELPTTYYRAREIRLTAYIENLCTTPWKVHMEWTILVKPDELSLYNYTLNITQPDAPLLVLPPQTLPNGLIYVHFFAKIGPYGGIYGQDMKFFWAISSPLVVHLSGGSGRRVSQDKDIIFDTAGKTYDPDAESDQSDWTYLWEYRNVYKHALGDWKLLSHDDLTARKKRSLSSPSRLVIPAGWLAAGQYQVRLILSTLKKTASFLQTLEVANTDVQELEVQ